MGDPCAALEFPVMTLVKLGAEYAIRFRGEASAPVSERLQQYWRAAWEKAGSPPPPLIIIDDIDPRLANEELRPVGLLRVGSGQ